MLKLALCLLTLASLASASEYYLSPRGDDANPGTKDRPWKTLARANAAAVAGDTITLFPGEYEGVLQPANSGERGRPITFRSALPRKAVLRGSPNAATIRLEAKQRFIVIDGFHVRPADGSWASLADCQDITVRNCLMEESRHAYVAFNAARCQRLRLLDNVFTRQLLMNYDLILHGNIMTLDHCDRSVVQGNDFSKAGHDPAAWMLTTNDVIRGNVFHCQWGRNFELFNSTPCLFEGNIIMENYHGSGSADSGSKVFTTDGIWRHNLAVRNWDYVIHSYSYKYGDLATFVLRNTRIYNNTFACNGAHAWGIAGNADSIAGNVWKNNVFWRNSAAGGEGTFLISTAIGADNLWTHSLITGDRPGSQVFIQFDPDARGMKAFDLAALETRFPGLYRANLDTDPRFTDADHDDYTLRPGSPCIDAGEPLARAVEPGSGTRVKIDDARWFYDGFGIEGEQGDLVMIGPRRQVARVVRTDRDAGLLELDRPVTWGQGDAVSLPYVGKAPDLGAMESGAEGRDWYHRLRLPPGTRWSPPNDPKAPLVTCDFEDADVEVWGYLWYWGRFDIPGTNTTPQRVDREGVAQERVGGERVGRASSPSGVAGGPVEQASRLPGVHDGRDVRSTGPARRCCVRIFAEKDNVALEALLTPRGWDIDRYPLIRFSYRIPPGVPVEARIEALPAQGMTGNRVVTLAAAGAPPAAGTPPAAATSTPVALIADDQWHEVTLDARAIRQTHKDVRTLFSFRLTSPTRYKQGQQFWFDDFAILPVGIVVK